MLVSGPGFPATTVLIIAGPRESQLPIFSYCLETGIYVSVILGGEVEVSRSLVQVSILSGSDHNRSSR